MWVGNAVCEKSLIRLLGGSSSEAAATAIYKSPGQRRGEKTGVAPHTEKPIENNPIINFLHMRLPGVLIS